MLRVHWKNLKYVLRHKWFVLQECIKIGLPFWVGIIHDWQKFTPTEWTPYALNFFGGYKKDERPQWLIDAFDRAWLHHFHNGPHHWEYWLSHGEPLEMPDRYRKEMLADWRGAGHAISGKDDTLEFYMSRRDKILLHPETRKWLELELGIN